MNYLFIVCQHGSHGRVEDMDTVKECLHNRLAQLQSQGVAIDATVWDTPVNNRLRSDKGTTKCGEALYAALRPVLCSWIDSKRALLSSSGGSGRMSFSCIGHSFGGILLRELVHTMCRDEVILDALDVKKDLHFASFVTAATPHCGIAMLGRTMTTGAYLIGKLYSQTYLDLLMSSNMLWSTMLSESYLDALKRFDRRVAFANIHKDPLVPFQTAAMTFDKDEADAIDAAFSERPGKRMLEGVYWRPNTTTTEDSAAPPLMDPPSRVASALTWAKYAAVVLRGCGWDIAPVRYDGYAPLAHGTIIRTTNRAAVMYDVADVVASCAIPLKWTEEACSSSSVSTPPLQ